MVFFRYQQCSVRLLDKLHEKAVVCPFNSPSPDSILLAFLGVSSIQPTCGCACCTYVHMHGTCSSHKLAWVLHANGLICICQTVPAYAGTLYSTRRTPVRLNTTCYDSEYSNTRAGRFALMIHHWPATTTCNCTLRALLNLKSHTNMMSSPHHQKSAPKWLLTSTPGAPHNCRQYSSA